MNALGRLRALRKANSSRDAGDDAPCRVENKQHQAAACGMETQELGEEQTPHHQIIIIMQINTPYLPRTGRTALRG